MFGAFKADRLKVNLRLVINRLKLLEKKKSKVYSEKWLLFSINSFAYLVYRMCVCDLHL